jgi:putative transposase
MPRRPRVFIPGMTQHIIQRGNNRADLFRRPSDFVVYVQCARQASLRWSLEIHAYVLMTNHVHLMVTAPSASALPRAMQAIGSRYVSYFNGQYSRTGTLFEGRYKSFVVDDENYWTACMRYIELNPIRAGLVRHPADYRWSSYRAHALGAADPLLTEHPVYRELGTSERDRCRCWQAFCAEGIADTELEELRGMRTGRVVKKLAVSEATQGSDP